MGPRALLGGKVGSETLLSNQGRAFTMILTYHEINSTSSPYVYSATVPELREHVQLIRSFSNFARSTRISFDDGHLSQFTQALPVLEKEHHRGMFFITAGWIGSRAGYMSWSQLRELAALGHEVQAHGLTHALLTQCTPEQLATELRNSRQCLQDRLGLPVNAISMPGGRWNARVLEACAQEGYRTVYTSHPYMKTKFAGGVTVIGRAMVRRSTTAPKLLALLHSEKEIWSRERIQFHLKHGLRSTLGDGLYHRLWRWAGNSGQSLAAYGDIPGGSE